MKAGIQPSSVLNAKNAKLRWEVGGEGEGQFSITEAVLQVVEATVVMS